MKIKISFRRPPAVLFCVILLSGIACAQPNVEALRKEKREATETFLDPGKPVKDRLLAAEKLGYPEASTYPELLRVGTDVSDDPAIRLIALRKLRYEQPYIDAVFSIIANTAEDETLAAGLIDDISRRTTFRQPAQFRQQLQSALRERLDDPRPAVRLSAYRTLVSSHDQLAIDRLVERLRDGSNIPIPIPDAIELLDIDGANKHIATLRPYLASPDSAIRSQAARALAVDPESRQDILELITDTSSPLEVRTNALRALSREYEGFVDFAIELMLNGQQSPDIRYKAMENAMRRLNYQGEPPSSQIKFAQAVRRLSALRGILTSDGRNLAAEAKKLIPHLNRSFPAVKRYFKNN